MENDKPWYKKVWVWVCGIASAVGIFVWGFLTARRRNDYGGTIGRVDDKLDNGLEMVGQHKQTIGDVEQQIGTVVGAVDEDREELGDIIEDIRATADDIEDVRAELDNVAERNDRNQRIVAELAKRKK